MLTPSKPNSSTLERGCCGLEPERSPAKAQAMYQLDTGTPSTLSPLTPRSGTTAKTRSEEKPPAVAAYLRAKALEVRSL